MNANQLTDDNILWADLVFISAMSIQSESANEVIRRCNKLNAKIVAASHYLPAAANFIKILITWF